MRSNEYNTLIPRSSNPGSESMDVLLIAGECRRAPSVYKTFANGGLRFLAVLTGKTYCAFQVNYRAAVFRSLIGITP